MAGVTGMLHAATGFEPGVKTWRIPQGRRRGQRVRIPRARNDRCLFEAVRYGKTKKRCACRQALTLQLKRHKPNLGKVDCRGKSATPALTNARVGSYATWQNAAAPRVTEATESSCLLRDSRGQMVR